MKFFPTLFLGLIFAFSLIIKVKAEDDIRIHPLRFLDQVEYGETFRLWNGEGGWRVVSADLSARSISWAIGNSDMGTLTLEGVFDLRTATAPKATWYDSYRLELGQAQVQVRIYGTDNWQTVLTHETGSVAAWSQQVVNLDDYRGELIEFRFVHQSLDGSWYIDDIDVLNWVTDDIPPTAIINCVPLIANNIANDDVSCTVTASDDASAIADIEVSVDDMREDLLLTILSETSASVTLPIIRPQVDPVTIIYSAVDEYGNHSVEQSLVITFEQADPVMSETPIVATLVPPATELPMTSPPLIVGTPIPILTPLPVVERRPSCGATSVQSVILGPDGLNNPLEGVVTDELRALGDAQDDLTANALSLGYAGAINLTFSPPIQNVVGPDIQVYETSAGDTLETARILASNDGFNWTQLGVAQGDGTFDLGTLASAQYIRVVDVSRPQDFSQNASSNGFDLDAIEIINCISNIPDVDFVPLDVCWIAHRNGTGATAWEIRNTNPLPLLNTPEVKLRYDWEVFDGQGNRVQPQQIGYDSTNPNPVDTPYAQQMVVTWYLVAGNERSPYLGRSIAYDLEAYRCDNVVLPTVTFTPTSTQTPTPTNTPEMPEETSEPSPEITVAPTEIAIQVPSICFVEHQNEEGGSVWQITNPNPVPIQDAPEMKLLIDWTVYLGAETIQSGEAYDTGGSYTISTPYADQLTIEWYLLEANMTGDVLGVTIITASPQYTCTN
ncbi:MAG: hypothetical protein AAF846_23495 [Chloroflexota bacterium]